VTDDAVYSCGASIEEALTRTDVGGPVDDVVEFLRQFEDYERFRERGYRWVADNRDRWGRYLSKTPPAPGIRRPLNCVRNAERVFHDATAFRQASPYRYRNTPPATATTSPPVARFPAPARTSR